MPHIVKPFIDGDWIGLDFECTEPETALCRMMCPPGDSYACELLSPQLIDGEWWHVGTDFDFETNPRPLHKLVPAERCTILDWDDIAENFGDTKTPLREGEIEFAWNGDYYEWRYVEKVEES
jgi:hypothetical protein